MAKLNKLLCMLVVFCLLNVSYNSHANINCDWTSINRTPNDVFEYNKECHHRVGVLVKNEIDYEIQTKALRKSIDLKDLTIKELNVNSDMWEKEASNQFSRFEKYKNAEKKRNIIWFGSGVGATVLAILLVGQLNK